MAISKNEKQMMELMHNKEITAQVTTSCHTIGYTIVSGSANPGFLLDAINEMETYRTPKKIVDYIEAERLKVIIGNPPFDVSGHCH